MKSGKHQFFYYKNKGAAVYVGSFLKEHNPLFSVGKLRQNKLMQRFYWSKCWECNVVHLQVHKNI